MKWRTKHSNEDSARPPLSQHEQRTRELIRLVRHDEEALMDRSRWMPVANLVFIHGFSAAEVFETVGTDPEQRFELSDDLTEIRMRRRHRHSNGVGLELAVPPERLYHCTAYILAPYILKTGILGYVTLYNNKDEAIENGENLADTLMCVEVDAKKMKEEGAKLYRTRKGSWISFSVGAQYITNIFAKGNDINNRDFIKRGRKLSYLLRHDERYAFDEHGWREVSDLIDNHGYTLKELCEIVATNNKKRYEFSEDMALIRACQGHSIPVDVQLTEAIPPDILYHGTAKHFVESIRQQGIQRRCRLYVHLTDSVDNAINVGQRHGAPVVLEIDARRMSEDGIKFFRSHNDVWLTEFVDAKYITTGFD